MDGAQPQNAETSSSSYSDAQYVLVAGIGLPTSRLYLADGVSMIPLPGPLGVFDLANAGAAGLGAWNLIAQVAPMCTCEIECTGAHALDTIRLVGSLLVLRGFGNLLLIATSSYPWSIVAERRKQTADWYVAELHRLGIKSLIAHSGDASSNYLQDA